MVAHDKKKKLDFGPFADDGLVARALRGELEPVPPQSPEELPVYCEDVKAKADGTFTIHLVSYDGNGKMIGDDVCAPGSRRHADIVERHGELKPGQRSSYYRYKDGRTELHRLG